MEKIKCKICPSEFIKKGKTLYCAECRSSGLARKDSHKKYRQSPKRKACLLRYQKTNKRRISANKYNRSENGKASKLKYYNSHKQLVIDRAKKTQKLETRSRTNAHDKVKRLKIPRICILCHVTEKLIVHHKDKNVFNNNIENLIILCSSCHGKEHEALNQNLTLLR